MFRWDETKPENLSTVPLTWRPQDPLKLLLRAWLDVFNVHAFNSSFHAYVVFNQLSYLLDDDEVHAEFCIRAAPMIDQNHWFIDYLLWARYIWPARRPLLQDLLNRCITTRHMEGYRRIISKYGSAGEPPFPYSCKFYSAYVEGYMCTFFTRHIGKHREGDGRNGDEMGLCLLPPRFDRASLFYDGLFGAFWILV